MNNNDSEKRSTNRRKFLKIGLMSGVSAIAGTSLISNFGTEEEKSSGEKMRLLTPEGKIVEVDANKINKYPEAHITPAESRKGILRLQLHVKLISATRATPRNIEMLL